MYSAKRKKKSSLFEEFKNHASSLAQIYKNFFSGEVKRHAKKFGVTLHEAGLYKTIYGKHLSKPFTHNYLIYPRVLNPVTRNVNSEKV